MPHLPWYTRSPFKAHEGHLLFSATDLGCAQASPCNHKAGHACVCACIMMHFAVCASASSIVCDTCVRVTSEADEYAWMVLTSHKRV